MSRVVRTATVFILQLIALAIVHFIGFVVAAQLTGMTSAPVPAGSEQAVAGDQPSNTVSDNDQSAPSAARVSGQHLRTLRVISAVCLLNAAAMLLWMRRSTLSGLAFVTSVFAVFVMCMTVMPQSETWLFFGSSSNILRQAGLMGFVVSGIFAPASLIALGRWRKQDAGSVANEQERDGVLTMWRLVVCAVAYMILYTIFGYVAWRNPEVRALYGGGELLGFWAHTTSAPTATRILPFQLLRGTVWGLLCLAMVRSSKGSKVGKALVIGTVLAVVMNAQLLLPNPVMPRNVRMIHLVETASSNFLFGIFAVLVWTRPVAMTGRLRKRESGRP